MKPFLITLAIILGILVVYFLYVLIIVFLFNKKVMGVRGEDPHNPCYLQFEDYEDTLERREYQTGYYAKAINGYIYQEKGRASFKGFIIMAHGFFGSHVQYLVDIAFLCKNGYQVLAFDQYGVGISEGEAQVSLANGIYVLENVIRDVEKRNLQGNLKLMLYGHSWGAYSCAGALRTHPEIEKAILRSGPVDPIAAGSHLLKMAKPSLYSSIAPLNRFCSFLLLGHRNMIKSTRGPKKNKTTDILVLHAKDDPMVEVSNSLALYYEKHPQKNVQVIFSEHGKHNTIITEAAIENYHKAVEAYKKIEMIQDAKEKTREEETFIKSLDRVSMYPYNTEVCNEILNFLSR